MRQRCFRSIAALAALAVLGVGASAATYTVKSGDTLGAIARRSGVTVGAIAAANKIADPNHIRIGQKLTIPDKAAPAGAVAGSGRLPARLLANPDRLALRPRFDYWAGRNSIPSDLLQAVAWVESGWQANRVSSAGAIGIGQLMPATVDFVRTVLIGVKGLDPYKAEDNIRMSARFLRYLLKENGGDVDRTLASYYQGLRSVRERGILAVSRTYIAAINSHRPMFR
jgi:LysM repeat protein